LVLADEPTGNLDFATGEKVLDLLDRLVRALGRTLILVTHSPEVARRSDRVIRLTDGRLSAA
jgi:putative ABC transport system ATP-binding protein